MKNWYVLFILFVVLFGSIKNVKAVSKDCNNEIMRYGRVLYSGCDHFGPHCFSFVAVCEDDVFSIIDRKNCYACELDGNNQLLSEWYGEKVLPDNVSTSPDDYYANYFAADVLLYNPCTKPVENGLDLGRAIVVTGSEMTSLGNHYFDVSLSECIEGVHNNTYKERIYSDTPPTVTELEQIFSEEIHDKHWYSTKEIDEILYVFEVDWKKWKRQKAGVLSAINKLLL
jgi:hypothetical protein